MRGEQGRDSAGRDQGLLAFGGPGQLLGQVRQPLVLGRHALHRGGEVRLSGGGRVNGLLLGQGMGEHLLGQVGHQFGGTDFVGGTVTHGGAQRGHPGLDPVGKAAVVGQHGLEGFSLGHRHG
jgi:hypothetical protein